MNAHVCPSRQELFMFSVGRTVGDNARQQLSRHVNSCQGCQATLAFLDDTSDAVVAALRQTVSTCGCSDSTCEQLLGSDRPEFVLGQTALPEPEAGTQLEDYRLVAKLSEGGMGAVFRAIHTRLGKTVAVKVLRAERSRDPVSLARFLREIQLVGTLEHPNLVRALDARELKGRHILVMEFLEGIDLRHLLDRQGPLPIPESCEAIRQACMGLEYASRRHGLVHRDVKPSNLMLTSEGCVKVLDLGLALAADEVNMADFTRGQLIVGTIDYMAPEQWLDSEAVDSRADVYSLGCTLYHVLTGRPPYGEEGDSAAQTMWGHFNAPLPRLGDARPDAPATLDGIIGRLLAKQPQDRFPTPGDVATALLPLTKGQRLAQLVATAGQSDHR